MSYKSDYISQMKYVATMVVDLQRRTPVVVCEDGPTGGGGWNALQNTIEWIEAEIEAANEWTEDGK